MALEERLFDYLRERRKQRGNVALSLFGIETEPDLATKIAFNDSLNKQLEQLRMVQNQVFKSRDERIKARKGAMKDIVDTLRATVNERMKQANSWERVKLQEQNKALENYYKGLELSHEILGDEAAVGGPPRASTADKEKAAMRALQGLVSTNPNPRQTGTKLAAELPNLADQEEVLKAIKASHPQVLDTVMAGVEDARKGRMMLTDQAMMDAGVDVSDPQAKAYAMLALRQKTDPDGAYTLYLAQDHDARNLQLHYGGGFGATLAELSKVMSGQSRSTVNEVLDDMKFEMDLSDEEAKTLSNANKYQEQLMASMYDPNAPNAAVTARDALLQDPEFLTFKQTMGFNSDRAAFIALRRELRKERRKKQREDRRLLRESRRGKGAQAIAAMKALRENQQKAKTLQAPMPPASANVAQPEEPAMTTGKTLGGTNT